MTKLISLMRQNAVKMGEWKFLALFALVFVALSCQKQSDEGSLKGPFGIKVNMLSVEAERFQNGRGAEQRSSSEKIDSPVGYAQQAVLPFGEGFSVVATLTPETVGTTPSASAGLKAQTGRTLEENELAANTAYLVLAYDAQGNRVAQRSYRYKNLVEETDFESDYEGLNVGEMYTFVVVSLNGTSDSELLNSVSNIDDLNALTVHAEHGSDLLFFKRQVTIKNGLNYLDVKLKHKFSQVTAYISVDESNPDLVGTRIYNVVDASISPTFQSASLRAVDEGFVYGAELSNGAALDFGGIGSEGASSLQSQTVSVISDGTDAVFNIGSMIVNQITNGLRLTDFPASGGRVPFRLQPGVRYTLRLEIAAPCTEIVTGSGGLSISNGDAGTFTFTESDFGAEIDIYTLDNSFNMRINDQPLYIGSYANSASATPGPTHNEIQFQGFGQWPTMDFVPNIIFADGSRWGVDGVPEIFNMNGTTDKPILRIVINDNGIAIYGSKEAGGDLYPLRLINEETVRTSDGIKYVRGRFNPDVRWYSDRQNTIVVSQHVMNTTYLTGNVRGKKIVPCSSVQ